MTLEDWHKRLLFLPDFESAYLSACAVVAGTCVGIAGRRSLPERFDWAIIDEAGRATPSEILIPMVRAKHSILVGDHKQLPPVIEFHLGLEAKKRGEIDPVWLEKSLFEFLFERLGTDSRSILLLQYRMHPHLANLIGKVFYPDEPLETHSDAGQRWHGWEKWNTAVVWGTTSQRSPERRNETDDHSIGKYNLPEVEIIVQQLLDLEKSLANRKQKKRVAVIAGYSAQVEQLTRQIEPDNKRRWKNLGVEINTVDAFQGREEDIVFYSVVRSNRAKSIGFLDDSRRLNVALSRARELLFIVGDHKMVAAAETYPNPNPFKAVVAHIIGHPAECTIIGV